MTRPPSTCPGRAARPRLRRRPPGPGRRRGVAGAAPRVAGRAHPAPAHGRERAGRRRRARVREPTFGDTLRRRGRPPRGTWSRPPPAAAGCRARRSCPASASAWARGPRCCGWRRRGWPARCAPGCGRGRPSARRWPCATASRAWPSGPRARTPRTSGPSSSSSPTPASASTSRRPSTPSFQSDHFPSSFWPRRAAPGQAGRRGRHDPATVEGLRRRGHPGRGRRPLVAGPPPAPPAATRRPASCSPPPTPRPPGVRGGPWPRWPSSTKVNDPWRVSPVSRTSLRTSSGWKMPSRSLSGLAREVELGGEDQGRRGLDLDVDVAGAAGVVRGRPSPGASRRRRR